jgi:hypothetical protein
VANISRSVRSARPSSKATAPGPPPNSPSPTARSVTSLRIAFTTSSLLPRLALASSARFATSRHF